MGHHSREMPHLSRVDGRPAPHATLFILLVVWLPPTTGSITDAELRFLTEILECNRPLVTGRLDQCINLAPDGTGSASLFAMLKRYSNFSHHDHGKRMIQNPRDGDPTCFIMTVREPAARLSSLFRHAAGPVAGDEIVRALANATHPLHHNLMHGHSLTQVFRNSQISYLLNNRCAAHTMNIHLVCYEHLDSDIASLLSESFGINTAVVHRANRTGSLDTKHTVSLSPTLRDFVNNEMFPLDTMLHEMACGSRGIPDDAQISADRLIPHQSVMKNDALIPTLGSPTAVDCTADSDVARWAAIATWVAKRPVGRVANQVIDCMTYVILFSLFTPHRYASPSRPSRCSAVKGRRTRAAAAAAEAAAAHRTTSSRRSRERTPAATARRDSRNR